MDQDLSHEAEEQLIKIHRISNALGIEPVKDGEQI
jgi:hypothetical protein